MSDVQKANYVHISIMDSRFSCLVKTIAGYAKTGTPLVAWDGTRLGHVATGDDMGIYYFVPRVAALTHTGTQQAINLFCGGTLLLALLCGLVGSFMLFKTAAQRLVALIGLLWLTRIGLGIGDVYLFSIALAMATVPLFLWFLRQNRVTPAFYALLFATGAAVSTGNWLRSQAGTGVVLFMAILLLAGLTVPLKSRLLLLLCLFAGMPLPALAFKTVENRAEAYMIAHQPGYQPLIQQHVVWHSVYIGLGYLTNEYGIAYHDEIAAAKVASIDPTVPYCSAEYERILKRATLQFVRAHLNFTMETVAAKCGVLLYLFVRYANIGLYFAWRYRRPRALDAAFWTAIGVGLLPGLLVVPYANYATGFTAFAVLYAIVCINAALESKGREAKNILHSGPNAPVLQGSV